MRRNDREAKVTRAKKRIPQHAFVMHGDEPLTGLANTSAQPQLVRLNAPQAQGVTVRTTEADEPTPHALQAEVRLVYAKASYQRCA